LLQQKLCGRANHDSSGGSSSSLSSTGSGMQIFATTPQLQTACKWSKIEQDRQHKATKAGDSNGKPSSWRATVCFH